MGVSEDFSREDGEERWSGQQLRGIRNEHHIDALITSEGEGRVKGMVYGTILSLDRGIREKALFEQWINALKPSIMNPRTSCS